VVTRAKTMGAAVATGEIRNIVVKRALVMNNAAANLSDFLFLFIILISNEGRRIQAGKSPTA
jgi:hypothetical protein